MRLGRLSRGARKPPIPAITTDTIGLYSPGASRYRSGEYLETKLRAADPETHAEMMKTIKAHSPQSWAHINMLGEYDFSDKKLADSFGILPLKNNP